MTSITVHAKENLFEISIESNIEKVVIIEGPYQPFSAKIFQDNRLVQSLESNGIAFPFILFKLPNSLSLSPYIIKATSEKTFDTKLFSKLELSDELSLDLFSHSKPIIDASDSIRLSEILLKEPTIELAHYLKDLVMSKLLQASDLEFVETKRTFKKSNISQLRKLFLELRQVEKHHDKYKILLQLEKLIAFLERSKLISIYPNFVSLLKSKIASVFSDIDFNKLSPLLPKLTLICEHDYSHKLTMRELYKLLKVCFLDTPLVTWKKNDNPDLLFNTLKGYWLYHNRFNEHEDAIIFLTSAINTHSKVLDNLQLGELTQILGLSLGYIGKLSDEISAYHKSIDIIKTTRGITKQTDIALADMYYSLALAYLKVGKLDKAKRFIEKTIEIESQVGTTNGYYISYYAAGKIEREKGNGEQAREIHEEVLKNLNPNFYHHLAAEIELIKDHVSLENFSEAEKITDRVCFNENTEFMFEAQILDCLLLKSELRIKANEFTQAQFYIDATHQCTKDKNCSNETLLSLIETPLNLDGFTCKTKNTQSIEHTHYPIRQIKLSILTIESSLNCEPEVENAYKRAKKIISHITPDMYQAASFISITQKLFDVFVTSLFNNSEIAEKEKKYRLVNAIEESQNFNYISRIVSQIQPSMTPDVEVKLTTLWQKKIAYEKEFISSQITPERRSSIHFEIDKLSEKLFTFFRQSISTQTYKSTSLLSLGEIIEKLEKDQAIVHFFSSENKFYVLFSSREQSTYYALEASEKFNIFSQSVNEGLNTKNLLGLLKNILITDFFPKKHVDLTGIKKLILVTDGLLDAVPFNAFNKSTSPLVYHPIIEEIEIIKTNSVSQYLAYKTKPTISNYDITVVADPLFGNSDEPNETFTSIVQRDWLPSLLPLPHSRHEAENVASLFHNSKVNLLLGEQATNSALFSPAVRNSTLLHIATHGFMDRNYPDLAAFATSKKNQNGYISTDFVTMTELTRYKFTSELVILSGCETALGAFYNGVGINSLTQRFILQGAGSVISSLWKIDDMPTSLFMNYFYTNLRKNKGNTSAALADAKRKFISSGIYSHPKYWAGFVLTVANNQYERINLTPKLNSIKSI
ncbi:CHAT domain-containing tetratricopeptide repeat protein [Paraglaciecola sp.]|uniref:CHAT domain-containing protein n=1 Tax=Paraglaciecola sp. TaxID=1920173 RepID=UPI003266DF50